MKTFIPHEDEMKSSKTTPRLIGLNLIASFFALFLAKGMDASKGVMVAVLVWIVVAVGLIFYQDRKRRSAQDMAWPHDSMGDGTPGDMPPRRSRASEADTSDVMVPDYSGFDGGGGGD